jgi:hypothetical protein
VNAINYKNIADSVEFYQRCGIEYIETPWYVTKEAMDVTKPSFIKDGDDYYIPKNQKYLVASAEQSFIYLMFKGQLVPGWYQSVTPCYRFEPIDSIHRKVFMKNELIYLAEQKEPVTYLPEKLDRMIELAQSFFSRVIDVDRNEIKRVEVPQENSIHNFDLQYKGHELGSYGIRRYKNLFMWIYGTGCAEPRLSIVKKI